MTFQEFDGLDLPKIDEQILAYWERHDVFARSISERDADNAFVFYEGPPSANGLPGIHHVMGRTIKDMFCRFQTLNGKRVDRKGGWDTHGLPVELKVESELGITKEDIGTKISVDDYNKACRETVMRYKDIWDDLTRKMGYWVDLENPYITFEPAYMESVWWLLKQIYDKGLMYKGYTIQPYSPAAGTGLSSHELNMPGAYQDVTDTTVVAMFKADRNDKTDWLFSLPVSPVSDGEADAVSLGSPDSEAVYLTAWTTTPWTLPSNTALTVGPKIEYVKVRTKNQYTGAANDVVLAKELLGNWFGGHNQPVIEAVSAPFTGEQLVGTTYEQLLTGPVPTDGDAFRVISGNFVTTDAGTGIVHTAPSFGQDDMAVGRANGIGSLTLVDKQGKFTDDAGQFAGRYVKNYKEEEGYRDVNVDIAIHLKTVGQAFNVAKYNHSYPHCWRTDKPVLYYPLDSWFIKSSAVKERMQALNDTINWQPASTGEGRFGKWLENLNDWNLSRSRYWGIPLPIWRSACGTEEVCIGSIAELQTALDLANDKLGLSQQMPKDLHRPYIDEVILWQNGKRLVRELDLIDVWFDSGAMPYAQWGFPGPLTPEGGTDAPKIGFQTANAEFYPQLKEYAREMRNRRATPAEDALWEELSAKQLDGYKFRRQHVIGSFIVDFVCLKKRLVIEVDGSVHDSEEAMEYDKLRSAYLKEEGYQVLRLRNAEVLENKSSALRKIRLKLASCPEFSKEMLRHGLERVPPFGGQGAGSAFPADFIAEGVDQTRGWFYTLHAIATMVFDSVAFRNVVSNGLVLDKEGKKMSKRLGNAVDPFTTLSEYGADATRWYMISNSAPWDNLKFDLDGVAEVRRRFFGTLYNTYGFFALYANIDAYHPATDSPVAHDDLAEIDRWIISRLNTLTASVHQNFTDYDATPACRAIDAFVNDELSNWYVRQCRRRFWRGEMTTDKRAAYQTLYTCLERVAQLMSPVAPFFADWLWQNLQPKGADAGATSADSGGSVHLSLLEPANSALIDEDLEQRMAYAQRLSSLVLSLRKRNKLRVRQPLQKILVPALDEDFRRRVAAVAPIIQGETNVKEVEFLTDDDFLKKSIKANFKVLGKKVGKQMKTVAAAIGRFTAADISRLESEGSYDLALEDGSTVTLTAEDVNIATEDIPGWVIATDRELTVALDVNVTEELAREGLARELVNRIQNLRKDGGLEVTDRIRIRLSGSPAVLAAVADFGEYISEETLADELETVDTPEGDTLELPDGETAVVSVVRSDV